MADARTARVLITVLLFALGLGFLYVTRETLIAFLFAIFFAYLMGPLVAKLERVLKGRGRAIAAIYALLLALVVVFFVIVGPKVTRDAARLGQALPGLLEKFSSGELTKSLEAKHGWRGPTVDALDRFLVSHESDVENIAQRVGLRTADVAKQAWLLFVVPILSIFFLKDGRAFSEVLLATIHSRPQREFLENVLNDLNHMLAHFIRAQLTLAGVSLLVYSAFLAVMQVPYPLVLGTIGGVLEFIPVIGPLFAGLTIIIVAVLTGYPHWLVLIIFLLVWRGVQDYVFSPRIMGESMELHPLAAIFGVMAGAEIAGILGVYLSIPVMASLRIVFRRWRLYSEKRKFGPLATDYSVGSHAIQRK